MLSRSQIVRTKKLTGKFIMMYDTLIQENVSGRLYHDTTSSFAALAAQSSMLSQSSSALFDRDHPPMNGKYRDGLLFRELKPVQSSALRAKLGLQEWDNET